MWAGERTTFVTTSIPKLTFYPKVNRWLSIRFCLVTNTLIGAVAFIAVLVPGITASTSGFALTLATTVPYPVSLNLAQM